MWLTVFPFARRTWASGIEFTRYLKMVAVAMTVGTALRILTV